jgi:large repetitive protein
VSNFAVYFKRLRRRLGSAFTAWLLMLPVLVLLGAAPEAQAVYSNRFATTTNGAMTFVGNTLGLDGSGTAGVPGTQGSIGAFISTNTALQVGTFPPGTTLNWAQNGSTTTLNLPPGSTVLYAELIWAGSFATGGVSNDVSASLNNSVTFKTPAGNYSVAPAAGTAQTLGTSDGAGGCTSGICQYVRSANVTGLVQIGLSGVYEIGAVPATVQVGGTGGTAGWTLAVVYSNPSLPPRSLSLFVGAEAGGAAPTGVTGFCTNLTGTVKGRLLVSALEGDTLYNLDQMKFGPNAGAMIPLSGPNNPVNNFFGGQINTDTGALSMTGSFAGSNHNLPAGIVVAGARQGYDITNVDVSGAMVNTQTSAFAQGTSNGDQYTITALGIQIDVGAPKFPLSVKTANKTTVVLGDTVTYTIVLDNTAGTASAANVVFTDTPPPGMSFVPGSVTINGVANATANPVTGFPVGNIVGGAVATVTFQVKVDAIPASPAVAQYVNKAKWSFDFISCANQPSEAGFVETNPNTITAIRLEPTKVVSPTGPVGVGQTLTYTITVPNTGAASTVSTTLTDLIPAGTSYVAGTTTLNGVAVPDLGGNMPFVAGALINSPTLGAGVIGPAASAVIRFKVIVNPSPPAIITNTAAIDPDGAAGPAPAINVAAVNTPLTPPVAAKSFTPSTIATNTPSVLTILVTNINAQPLSVLALSDTLPAGMVIANPANATTTCPGGVPVAIPGGITLGLSNGSVLASSTCTVSANVTSATPGVYTNLIPAGAVSTANAGSNVAPTTAVLTVLQGPTINKSFAPGTISPGSVSTLSISIVNPTSFNINGVGVTDNLPSGVVVAPVPNATTTCGGTFAPVAGATSVTLAGGSVIAANFCTVTVNVTAAAVGSYANIIPVGALSSSAGTNAVATSADLNVAAPIITKSFSPAVVGTNVNSVLTITLNNPTNTAATGVAFTDLFPTTPGALTLTNTNTPNTGLPVCLGGTLTNQNGTALAAGNTGVKVVNAQIPAGSSCSYSFNVIASVGGNYVNTIPVGGLTTANIGSSAVATSATLSVGLPSVNKAFGSIATPTASIALGGSTPVAIRFVNPNGTPLAITSFTDAFPAGLTLANITTTSSCTGGGAFTNLAGGAIAIGATGIKFSGASIPANGNCTITFNVTSNTAGVYVNTIAADGLVTPSGNNAFPSSATLSVLARPTIVKAFTPANISPGGTSTLTITLSNSNAETLTTATFNDTFPTAPGAMTLANTSFTNTCGGTVTQVGGAALAIGASSIRLAGGSIPGNGSCELTFKVTAPSPGLYTNSIAAGALATNNGGVNNVAATADLNVAVLPPTISKAFATSPVGINVPTRLTFTVGNPNAALAIAGLAFSDTFPTTPGAMIVASTPNVMVNGCGAGFTFNPVAGSSSINFSGGTVAVGASCQVSVDVVANIPGTYNNTSGTVGSTNAGTGGVATASLRVLASPFVAKSFSVNPVAIGSPTVLTVTISNPNAADPLTGVSVNDIYPAGLLNAATPSPQIVCSAGSSAAFTGGVANGNSIGLTSGSLTAGGYCSISVNVVASVTGNIDNTTLAVTSANAGTGNTAFSRLAVGVDVSGFVYSDVNINNVKDSGEAGTGQTLFAKLVSGGTAQQVVPVNPTTGAYAFAPVVPGTYSIVIDNNNTNSDITPSIPSGWVGTEQPTQLKAITVGSTAFINQNFGLNNGTKLTGRVFQDNGIASGIANDGIPNGGEIGIAGVTVRLTNCGATTYASATTDGTGSYTLVVPSSVTTGATLCVTQTKPSGYIETGGSAGTTTSASGTYSRATSTTTFSYTPGVSHTGINFGNVPVNTFSTDGLQTILPGATVNYPHTFVAGSGGSVTFTSSAAALPVGVAGWSEVLYRDTNCNGQLDAGEPALTGAINLNAGDQVCVIVKEFVPAGLPIGAQNLVTVTAAFTYTNATPALNALLTRTDTTIVGNASSAGLKLVKSVNLTSALPGATLIYTITYRNDSSGPLSTLTVSDTTPAFTSFVSAACGTTPANLTACTVSTNPIVGGTGGIAWTFTGTLAPGSQGSVTFSVLVNN